MPQNRIEEQEMQSACQSPRTVCRLLEAPKPTLLCGEFLMRFQTTVRLGGYR